MLRFLRKRNSVPTRAILPDAAPAPADTSRRDGVIDYLSGQDCLLYLYDPQDSEPDLRIEPFGRNLHRVRVNGTLMAIVRAPVALTEADFTLIERGTGLEQHLHLQ